MDPAATLSIAKTAGEITKNVYELAKGLKGREEKQRVDEILDRLRDLKQSASELEDENRELKEKLRFKSDDFEFKNPFWYEKAHPDRPLCAKCFASNTSAPMGEPYEAAIGRGRKCLVCGEFVYIERGRKSSIVGYPGGGPSGPNSWMK